MSLLSEYYPSASGEELQLLESLWCKVKQLEPKAEEGFSYGLPALKLDGRPLIGFGLNKNYMSLYPYSPKIISTLREELKDYETTKGTVRFHTSHPLTSEVLGLIVDLRKAELTDGVYKKNQHGIETEAKDPIFDVMSDKELDEANKRINDLLNGS